MRAAEVDPSLPVLVVARCLDLDCYQQALRLGAMDYLVEPPTVGNRPPVGKALTEQSLADRNCGTALGSAGNLIRVRGPPGCFGEEKAASSMGAAFL